MNTLENLYEEGEERRQKGIKSGRVVGLENGFIAGSLVGLIAWYGGFFEKIPPEDYFAASAFLMFISFVAIFSGLLSTLINIEGNTLSLQKNRGLSHMKYTGLNQSKWGWTCVTFSIGLVYTAIMYSVGIREISYIKWVVHLPYLIIGGWLFMDN